MSFPCVATDVASNKVVRLERQPSPTHLNNVIDRSTSSTSTPFHDPLTAQPAAPTVPLEHQLTDNAPRSRPIEGVGFSRCHPSTLTPRATTVADVTDYSRDDWTEPGYLISGPRPDWHLVHRRICHHSGASVIPADRGQWLRNMQRDYEDNRGYSLGYLYLICQSGDSWEIRGDTFRSAANKGDIRKTGVENVNAWTAPFLFDTTPGEKATPAAIDTALRLWATKIAPPAWNNLDPVEGHNALDFTECPGTGITWQIAHGDFVDQPPTSGGDMRYLNGPQRILDSRLLGDPPQGQRTITLPDEIPALEAVMLTITAVDWETWGYSTLWRQGPRPIGSCLNWGGDTGGGIANTTVVSLEGGRFQMYLHSPTHIILDVVGYQ